MELKSHKLYHFVYYYYRQIDYLDKVVDLVHFCVLWCDVNLGICCLYVDIRGLALWKGLINCNHDSLFTNLLADTPFSRRSHVYS